MDLLQILIDQKEELGSVDTSMLCPRNEESEIELQSKLAQVVIGVQCMLAQCTMFGTGTLCVCLCDRAVFRE